MPHKLKIAKIVPVCKDDDPTILSHYRTISIPPTVWRILERLAYSRLLSQLDKHEMLYLHQYGLRKSCLTHMAIFHFTNQTHKTKTCQELLTQLIILYYYKYENIWGWMIRLVVVHQLPGTQKTRLQPVKEKLWRSPGTKTSPTLLVCDNDLLNVST